MSKKKQRLKQQQQQKKEITTTIEMEISSQRECGPLIIGACGLIGTNNGPVHTSNATIVKSYKRDNKADKITALYHLKDVDFRGNQELDMLLQEFDGVYVIDTNTQVHPQTGDRLSVSCFTFLYKCHQNNPSCYSRGKIIFFTAINEPQHPEKTAIKQLVRYLERTVPYIIGRKFIIITDHDQNSHDKFNTHKSELFPGYTLPEYITLMYASAERGSDIVNLAIKDCDHAATSLLNEWINNGYIKDSLYEVLCARQVFKIPESMLGIRHRLLMSVHYL